jgi:hypothetical protein
MQRYLPQLRNARVGGVMIQKTGASSPHTCVWMGETPEHGIQASLACVH